MALVRPTPDLTGFAEALDAKRDALGSDVTFLMAPVVTWPPGTPVNQDTGQPYDPTIEPLTSTQEEVVVRCGVFFKAVNRGGAANAAISSEAGWDERTRIFAIAPWSAKDVLALAVEFIWHGDRYKIDVVKRDEIVGGVRRVLLYGAAR